MSSIETDVFNWRSKEFYRNLDPKEIAKIPKTSQEYLDLRDWEREKCINGLNLNGIHIPGSLYYTLNHHKIELDYKNPHSGRESRIISLPNFRDNEWILHEEYNKALEDKEGYLVGASRQCGKSEMIVSLAMRELFLFQNSEVVGVFTTKPDKDTFAKKATVAIQNGTDFLVVPNIDKDWTKDYIRFGITKKDNDPFIYSKLFLYLNNRGTNTEVAAGKSISFFFMDEIAKEEMKGTWEAVRPAIRGDYGYRCSPIFFFTGGNVEKSVDAEGLFFNPEANDLKFYENDGKKTAMFMSAEYQMGLNHKESISLVNFFENKYNLKIENPSDELKELNIQVTNKEYVNKKLDEMEDKAKSESLLAYQKQKMYSPRKVGDMFIKAEQNPFAHLTDHLTAQKEYNRANKSFSVYEVSPSKFSFSNKTYLEHYPLSQSEHWKFADAGICITELPSFDLEGKLYVGGADPFNTAKTATSASLGSWYIMKKRTVDYEDEHADCIVAWFNGRTGISEFRKGLLNSIELYKTTLLHEAADDNTSQWFFDLEKGYLLEDTYNLSREINPKTKALNAKGLRPNLNTQNFYIELILNYLEEELPNGKLGLTRLPDNYLIDQLLMFDGDLSPMDAIVAFGHALLHLHKDKRYIPRIWNYDEGKEERQSKVKDSFGLTSKVRNII